MLLTAADVLVVLFLQNKSFRSIEILVVSLTLLIGGCFAYEIIVSRPEIGAVLAGIVPSIEIVRRPEMLYIAVGILGATVMPHNLYLHSSIVQTRAFPRTAPGKSMAIRFSTIDSCAALFFALFINAAILILSAAVFHETGHQDVAGIKDAYKLLSEALPQSVAACVSRWRCWRPGRIPRSPARWLARL